MKEIWRGILRFLGLRPDPYRVLLKRTRGNRQQADRLVAYERTRSPGTSAEELARRALYRWDRDNR